MAQYEEAVLARRTPEGFSGCLLSERHERPRKDTSPEFVGPVLWARLHQECHGDIALFLKTYLDDAPNGWQPFVEEKRLRWAEEAQSDPEHYGKPWMLTQENAVSEAEVDWAYVLDPETRLLTVLESAWWVNTNKDRTSRWYEQLTVSVDEPEPDWAELSPFDWDDNPGVLFPHWPAGMCYGPTDGRQDRILTNIVDVLQKVIDHPHGSHAHKATAALEGLEYLFPELKKPEEAVNG